MPLRRVVVLTADSTRAEFRESENELRTTLARRGIGVVAEGGDGVVAPPGALRDFAELFQRYLAGNDLPCGLLNTSDYYTDLLKTTADSVVDRFVRETQRGRLIVQRDPHALVQAMAEYLPPETRRQAAIE